MTGQVWRGTHREYIAMARLLAQSVACPWCQAAAGTACSTAAGRPVRAPGFHFYRLHALNEQASS